jgi:hypothetical protein
MSILIFKNDQQEGPFDSHTIQRGLSDGRFTPDDFAWQEGCTDWVPLKTLVSQGMQKSVHPVKAVSDKIARGFERADSALARFLGEEQDAAAVTKIIQKAKDLLTTGEEIQYVGVQKKPLINIAPDAILLTNKRFMIVRPKIMGMTFDDHLWREIADVHMSEQMLSATITCTIVGGKKHQIDCIPKKQARKIYTFAQEVEERMHGVRRERELEERRAAAGGVVVHTPAATIPQAASAPPDPMEVLAKLKKMLEAGLIEVAEYDVKKTEILSRM